MENQQSNQAFTREYLNKLHEVVSEKFGPSEADATISVLEENSFMYLRMLAVVGAYRSGKTLEETATFLNLTRERVRQIQVKARALGILEMHEGGASLRSKNLDYERRRNKMAMEEKRIRKFFGCGREEFYRLNEGYSAWAGKNYQNRRSVVYIHQKRAAVRSAEWKLTFPEWWSVWEKSGNWAFHGRGKGKMTLARLDNNKPFEIGNVAIMPTEDVSSMAGAKAHKLWPDMAKLRRRGSSLDLIAKQEAALQMRNEGKPLKEIAKILRIGESTASGYATSARRRREMREKQERNGEIETVGIGTMLKKMFNR